ncbi:glycoside hydrolase 100 family protein [Thiococcus pfennigii]|uniref:glycoside hydrolase 100 family protein n=1 Tax=Thiococcus pfennigii TaxID=1057 RepID=UPI0030B91876
MVRRAPLKTTALDDAYRLLDASLMFYQGRPVGTAAANDPKGPAAENYRECFIRDFVVSGLVFLADGKVEIVRDFLLAALEVTEREHGNPEQTIHPSVMPASFRIRHDALAERLEGDFGERAIGRVAPVDSVLWWTLLLCATVQASGDRALAARADVQRNLKRVLALCANDAFEVYPTLMVPDGAFMVDRRMGVYGHPLEIQALFYGALRRALHYVERTPENRRLIALGEQRLANLRDYLRRFYWLDLQRLSAIHRFPTEEYGGTGSNLLNIHPESIPEWVTEWLPEEAGYLVGNLGPGRMDFRFFSQGNLLAILFGLTTVRQATRIMSLIEARWGDLVGAMPLKLCFPALSGEAWRLLTGSDPKNAPWSYHNGGNWPVLLWPLVAAALKSGRRPLAERAFEVAAERLPQDRWPEYYDGKGGRLIGRHANLCQTWSAAGLILAHKLLEDPSLLSLLPE